MQTQPRQCPHTQGSVLIVTMCVIAIAAIALASYFSLVQYQTAAVARSQSWNSALPLAEAGVDEALAFVNKGAPNIITDPWAWTNNVTPDGWTPFTNGHTTVTRSLNSTSSYTATVDISGGTPVISALGMVSNTTVHWGASSASGPFLAAAVIPLGGSSGSILGRQVRVQTVLNPLFTAAVVTKSNFNMKGNNTVVDSFDSSNPLYSTTNGQYTVARRRVNGDVATDSSVVDTLHFGNGNIYGRVMTGPGTAQDAVQIGSQGAVGDAAWNANPTNRGSIQPGYWSGDFNVNIPDVQPPGGSGNLLPAPVGGYITLNGGFYTSIANPAAPLRITAPTTVWIQGNFSAGLTIASTNNASLVLYVGTTNTANANSIDLSGQGAINAPGLAQNLQIYGLPSLTSIDFTGNSAFSGTIYAPEAALRGGGGGHNDLDTSGAMIVASVTLNGHWNFHYDEHLKVVGPCRGWIANNWKEVSPNN